MSTRARAAHLGPELRRPLVLDAALELFAARDYDAVSMQEIAEAAGVTKPVLYTCFAGKDELFGALVRREDRRLWDLVEQAMPPAGDPGDDEAALRQGLTGLLRAVAASPEGFRVIYLQPTGAGRVERGREHWERRMSAVIAARRPGVPERETRLMGRMIVAAAEIGFRTLLDEPDEWQPDELAAALAALLTSGARRVAS